MRSSRLSTRQQLSDAGIARRPTKASVASSRVGGFRSSSRRSRGRLTHAEECQLHHECATCERSHAGEPRGCRAGGRQGHIRISSDGIAQRNNAENEAVRRRDYSVPVAFPPEWSRRYKAGCQKKLHGAGLGRSLIGQREDSFVACPRSRPANRGLPAASKWRAAGRYLRQGPMRSEST
jgi:hypothetical protein